MLRGQSTLDLLFTSQRLVSGKTTGVGIAWRSAVDAKGRRVLQHGGSSNGGRAMLMLFPESGVVVAMLSNVFVENVGRARRSGAGALKQHPDHCVTLPGVGGLRVAPGWPSSMLRSNPAPAATFQIALRRMARTDAGSGLHDRLAKPRVSARSKTQRT